MSCSRVLGAVALLCTLSSLLVAQGWIDPVRPVPQDLDGRVERLRSAVQVSITGRVARVTVEEWFRNNGPALEEGMYHFPLPGEAVFSSYSRWQGDQELRGEAMDATQARSIYEAIVRQKRDPALIELAGQGLIRARVFPIAPGETRKITLKYTQLLDRAGDAWRFRYLGDKNRQSAPRSFRRAGDRFRLVAFSGGVRRYAQEWTGVSAETRRDAENWIRSLDAEGGTNIAGALAEAFAQAPAEQSLGVVVFLTDGQASTGETDPEKIAASAEQDRGKFRVFSFGVGDDVNTYLLDRR